MMATLLAALFWIGISHYSDGSSLTVNGGTRDGSQCYYSIRADCPEGGTCEAASHMFSVRATMPQCVNAARPALESLREHVN